MKSIKPGRGPSGLSFIGSIAIVIFGIFWTITAFSFTKNSSFGGIGTIFPFFGIIFIIIGVINAVYNYKNATSKDRFSIIDITDSNEEGDPSSKWIKDEILDPDNGSFDQTDDDSNYCPYCGRKVKDDHSFCAKCGKAIK